MSYLCDGDLLLMNVDLPEPIGTVTYSLRRVPRARMPEGFADLFDRRFEPAE